MPIIENAFSISAAIAFDSSEISHVHLPVAVYVIRASYKTVIRELKNHDEVDDDDVCWLGKDWNENVSFGGKKET